MQMNNQSYGDKEILFDALNTQKQITANYNTFANECADPVLRNTMMDILNDEHSIQFDVFCELHSRGLYPTPMADSQKVEQAKQKYRSGTKGW
ncbi:hypothetical protein SDC9_186802 [bioreactor metagenome]|uniref:Coat F domain-containing protein n=1 Tax=bioreactor metagenome TaxID=1076179 RepID=A0A645HSZ6_9ZZZZ